MASGAGSGPTAAATDASASTSARRTRGKSVDPAGISWPSARSASWRLTIATSIWSSDGRFVVIICTQIPGMVSARMSALDSCRARNWRISYATAAMIGMRMSRLMIVTGIDCRPMSEKQMIEMMMTTTRNSVPQRGCAVGYARTRSAVSGSPFSSAWIDMCSAPWYWNVRRTSPARPMRSR